MTDKQKNRPSVPFVYYRWNYREFIAGITKFLHDFLWLLVIEFKVGELGEELIV